MMQEILTAKKLNILCRAGGLRNGYEHDRGSIWHAVSDESAASGAGAVCGVQPAIQWSTREGDYVTCPRCRKILERSIRISTTGNLRP